MLSRRRRRGRERVWCAIKEEEEEGEAVWCVCKGIEGGQGAMDKKVGVCVCIHVLARGLMMVCLVLSMVNIRGDEER